MVEESGSEGGGREGELRRDCRWKEERKKGRQSPDTFKVWKRRGRAA